MADIQHREARKLLKVISKFRNNDEYITYREASKQLGRLPPQKHGKATAQICDFLDAAACLAGVPLLALVKIRNMSEQINPKAFKKEYGPRRDAIINRSKMHQFTPSDYLAIDRAIDDLGKRGNRKAWRYLNTLYPGDLLYRRLVGDYGNAIDDLGTDMPAKTLSEVESYARDPEVRKAALKRAQGKCEFCSEIGFTKPDGTRYLESHHVIALASDGEDRLTNVIALCANDHRKAHFGDKSEEMEKQMILKLKAMYT